MRKSYRWRRIRRIGYSHVMSDIQCFSTSIMFSQFMTIMALMRLPLKSQCLKVQVSKAALPRLCHSDSLPSIIHIRLHTHIESTQVLDTSLGIFNANRLLIHAQGFIALRHQPLVGLLDTSGIRRDDKSWPKSVRLLVIWQLISSNFKELIDPVQMCLQIQIIPEAVAEDVCIRLAGFVLAEEFAVAIELVFGDGMSDHDFDVHINVVGVAGKRFLVVFYDIGGPEDSLHTTCFDVELIVAEAVVSAGRVSVKAVSYCLQRNADG